MRRRLLQTFAVLLLSAAAHGAATWVQAAGTNDGSTVVTSKAVTLNGVVAGNGILVAFDWSSHGGTNPSITLSDTNSGTISVLANCAKTQWVATSFVEVWFIKNAGAGTHVITGTSDFVMDFPGITADEVSGYDTTTPTENCTIATGAGSNPVTLSVGPITISNNGSLMWGFGNFNNGGTMAVGAGYTAGTNPGSNILTEHKAENTGSDSATETGAPVAAITWVMIGVVVRAPAAAATCAPSLTLMGAGQC